MTSKTERRIMDRFHIKDKDRSLSDIIRSGLPTANALVFIESTSAVVPFSTLLRTAGISQRTLERRAGKRLRPDQSDRLFRIARVIDFAEESIGTRAQALEWLNAPNQAMRGARPIEELDTDAGAKRVEIVLGRLREGIVA
jgi:putative toxin-antitoxin system antitoxin component (TIGR02293 family)